MTEGGVEAGGERRQERGERREELATRQETSRSTADRRQEREQALPRPP